MTYALTGVLLWRRCRRLVLAAGVAVASCAAPSGSSGPGSADEGPGVAGQPDVGPGTQEDAGGPRTPLDGDVTIEMLDGSPGPGNTDGPPANEGAADAGPSEGGIPSEGGPIATGSLKPLMVQFDTIRIRDDFEVVKPLDTMVWSPIQSTRWTMEGGFLKGIPATPEFQRSRSDHNGDTPIVDVYNLGDFALDVKIKFEGKAMGLAGIDFDHHILRIKSSGGGVGIFSGDKAVKVASGYPFVQKQWYHLLVEIKGDTLVVQFEDGPTLYATSAQLAAPKGEFRVVGPQQGTVYLDDITVWSIKPEPQPTWESTKAKLR